MSSILTLMVQIHWSLGHTAGPAQAVKVDVILGCFFYRQQYLIVASDHSFISYLFYEALSLSLANVEVKT